MRDYNDYDEALDKRYKNVFLYLFELKHAGSFARALAYAGLKADHVNRERIAEAFPELINQYEAELKAIKAKNG